MMQAWADHLDKLRKQGGQQAAGDNQGNPPTAQAP